MPMPLLSPDTQRLTDRLLALEAALEERDQTLAALQARLEALGGWPAVRHRAATHAQHAAHVAAAAAKRRATLAATAATVAHQVTNESAEVGREVAPTSSEVAVDVKPLSENTSRPTAPPPAFSSPVATDTDVVEGSEAVWTTIRSYLTREGHAKALAVFRALDVTRSGKVGLTQLKTALEWMGLKGVSTDALRAVLDTGTPKGEMEYVGLLHVLKPKQPPQHGGQQQQQHKLNATATKATEPQATAVEKPAPAASTATTAKLAPTLASSPDTSSPSSSSPPSQQANLLSDPMLALDFAKACQLLPYGVLGQALTKSGQFNNDAGSPPSDGCCIVDPAGLPFIQPPGRPGLAGGAAGAIYKWLGILQDRAFPPDVVEGVTKTGEAKYHAYVSPSTGELKHVIHTVGPDLRQVNLATGALPTYDDALEQLATCYANILEQFSTAVQVSTSSSTTASKSSKIHCNSNSGSNRSENQCRTLRLLPVSGGIFAGRFMSEIPSLTWQALQRGFAALSPSSQAAVLSAEVQLCIFAEAELPLFAGVGFKHAPSCEEIEEDEEGTAEDGDKEGEEAEEHKTAAEWKEAFQAKDVREELGVALKQQVEDVKTAERAGNYSQAAVGVDDDDGGGGADEEDDEGKGKEIEEGKGSGGGGNIEAAADARAAAQKAKKNQKRTAAKKKKKKADALANAANNSTSSSSNSSSDAGSSRSGDNIATSAKAEAEKKSSTMTLEDVDSDDEAGDALTRELGLEAKEIQTPPAVGGAEDEKESAASEHRQDSLNATTATATAADESTNITIEEIAEVDEEEEEDIVEDVVEDIEEEDGEGTRVKEEEKNAAAVVDVARAAALAEAASQKSAQEQLIASQWAAEKSAYKAARASKSLSKGVDEKEEAGDQVVAEQQQEKDEEDQGEGGEEDLDAQITAGTNSAGHDSNDSAAAAAAGAKKKKKKAKRAAAKKKAKKAAQNANSSSGGEQVGAEKSTTMTLEDVDSDDEVNETQVVKTAAATAADSDAAAATAAAESAAVDAVAQNMADASADEARRRELKPAVTEKDARLLLEALWGISSPEEGSREMVKKADKSSNGAGSVVGLKVLDSYDDVNFLVTTTAATAATTAASAATASAGQAVQGPERPLPPAVAAAEKEAEAARAGGNQCFQDGRMKAAVACYSDAIGRYQRAGQMDGAVGADPVGLLKTLVNRALAFLKTSEFVACIRDCDAALSVDPVYSKALFRRATARAKIEDWVGVAADAAVLQALATRDAAALQAVAGGDSSFKSRATGALSTSERKQVAAWVNAAVEHVGEETATNAASKALALAAPHLPLSPAESGAGESAKARSPPETVKKKYTLKVHNGVESLQPALLDLQDSMMRHLSKDGVACPTPVATKLNKKDESDDDEDNNDSLLGESLSPLGEFAGVCQLPVRGNQEHDFKAPLATRLLTWVEGSTLGVASKQFEEEVSINYKEDGSAAAVALMEDAGKFLGRMSLSLSTFTHPAAQRPHQWDLRAVPGIRQFLPNIKNANRRSLVEAVLSAFERDTKGCDAALPWAVIMGDYNDANIIVDPVKHKVAGVIDFGDAVYTWRINEVAIAMAYALVSPFGQREPLVAASAMLRGYRAAFTPGLLEIELKLIHLLSACRLACSYTLGASAAAKDPTNPYLLLHAEPAGRALEIWWSETDPADLCAALDLPVE